MGVRTKDFTRQVVGSLMDVSYSALPNDAIHSAKRMVLDGTACAIAGSKDVQYEPFRRYAESSVGTGSIPGPWAGRYDASSAALLCGAATHILDYDDVQTTMGGHPTSTLLPVIFALGYALESSGEELVRAVILGTELDARLGRAMNPAHYGVGWHPTNVIGGLGASLAASILLKFNAEQACNALGMAVSFAAGTKANFGTSTKSLHAGLAARAGVESALLTRFDATANRTLLDDQFGGYFNLYTPEVDRESLLVDIGTTFVVVDPGVSFKLLPCCGSIHSSVWAAIGLYEEGDYDASNIKAIRAYVDPKRIAHTSRVDVSNGLEAKFSSQYCQAVAAMTGRLTLADFESEAVNRSDRQELLKRVSILASDDVASWPNPDDSHTGSRGALVEIEDKGGRVVSKFNLVPRGYAADPASDQVLLSKFRDCVARDGRGESDVNALADSIMSLERSVNVRQVVEDVWNY